MEIKKILMKEFVEDGAVIPRWYGTAYRDLMTNSTVCYPIPLHLFVIGWRRLRWSWYKVMKFIGLQGRWSRQVNARDVLLRLANELMEYPGVEKGGNVILSWEHAREISAKLALIARRCLP